MWPEGTKMTTMSTGGRRKVHYTFPDESEMVEEYDLQTDELMVRKRCSKTVLGAKGEWVYEVGEAPARMTIENDVMRPSSSNPVLVRKDRVNAFEWRIRNLPYPKPTYSVTIDPEQRQVVVRTAKGAHRFDVEVARTPQEQEQGLMFRKEIAADGGMLFPMEPPRTASSGASQSSASPACISLSRGRSRPQAAKARCTSAEQSSPSDDRPPHR